MGNDTPRVRNAHRSLGVGTCDRIFEVLSAARRRATLQYLREADDRVTFQTLATELAHREGESEPPSLRREKWEDVSAALAHVHLPMMDDADLIEYDEVAGTVAAGENADLAWRLLDALHRER